jgi:hypothetical protein
MLIIANPARKPFVAIALSVAGIAVAAIAPAASTAVRIATIGIAEVALPPVVAAAATSVQPAWKTTFVLHVERSWRMNLMKNFKKRRPRRRAFQPNLRFSPYSWAKLLYLRDRGETEIGGFGLSAEGDPLFVVDILPVKQLCSPITVAFDDAAVADLFDELVDQGIHPQRFGRIWIHTHPGNSPLPSSVDEATFRRVFGRTDWSVMAIVARSDASYARMSFHVGPCGALEIPVRVDYGLPFDAADWEAWEQEYLDNVVVETRQAATNDNDLLADSFFDRQPQQFLDWEDFYDGTAGA